MLVGNQINAGSHDVINNNTNAARYIGVQGVQEPDIQTPVTMEIVI
jgi:hypothetical protein